MHNQKQEKDGLSIDGIKITSSHTKGHLLPQSQMAQIKDTIVENHKYKTTILISLEVGNIF